MVLPLFVARWVQVPWWGVRVTYQSKKSFENASMLILSYITVIMQMTIAIVPNLFFSPFPHILMILT
jgi:hypothetical protein